MAAPFERSFAIQAELEKAVEAGETNAPAPQDIMTISYRDDEAIYVIPSVDRVTVVFSTVFKEETDRIFGKVFLQEFVDARRQPSIQNAPQVLYSNREPPLEIRSISGLNRGEDVGYVTFVLFPRHFQNPTVRAATISRIQLFRDYLHYHSESKWDGRNAQHLIPLFSPCPQSSAQRRTCKAVCVTGSPSSSRCSIGQSQSRQRRRERRRAGDRSDGVDDHVMYCNLTIRTWIQKLSHTPPSSCRFAAFGAQARWLFP